MAALIPYQKIEIKTRMTQEATRQKLAEIVEPRKMRWGWSSNHRPFKGKIEGQSLKISRVIHYNNSFLPILVGQIRDDLDTSTLQITARPNLFIMFLWPLMGLIFVVAIHYSGELAFLWAIFPIFFFFYGIPIAFFNWELNKAKKLLDEQFETECFSLPRDFY